MFTWKGDLKINVDGDMEGLGCLGSIIDKFVGESRNPTRR
jgi:hypothetical protein